MVAAVASPKRPKPSASSSCSRRKLCRTGIFLVFYLCIAAQLAVQFKSGFNSSSEKLSSSLETDEAVKYLQNLAYDFQLTEDEYHVVNELVASFPIATSTSFMERFTRKQQAFCVPWNVSSDEWWTHQPAWEVFHEDATHYCFEIIQDARKRGLFTSLHRTQFRSDCSKEVVLTRHMWSSGYGADMMNAADGLVEAHIKGLAFEVDPMPWHYASPKPYNISTAACPKQNMYCYFLPLTNCNATERNSDFSYFFRADSYRYKLLYTEYITRMKTSFRKRVYDLYSQQKLKTPCTTIHVRRGDIVKHGEYSRRYHTISQYLNVAGKRAQHNILLLTDDHNAIAEALTNFPDRNWIFVNRTRFRGDEGGWEQHLPSNDAAYEIAVLFTIFRMSRQCSGLVRSFSNLGDLLEGQMKLVNASSWSARVENGDPQEKTFDPNNAESVAVSKSYDKIEEGDANNSTNEENDADDESNKDAHEESEARNEDKKEEERNADEEQNADEENKEDRKKEEENNVDKDGDGEHNHAVSKEDADKDTEEVSDKEEATENTNEEIIIEGGDSIAEEE